MMNDWASSGAPWTLSPARWRSRSRSADRLGRQHRRGAKGRFAKQNGDASEVSGARTCGWRRSSEKADLISVHGTPAALPRFSISMRRSFLVAKLRSARSSFRRALALQPLPLLPQEPTFGCNTISVAMGPGRVKTPKLNLPIEISSRHRQFEKPKTLTTTVGRRR